MSSLTTASREITHEGRPYTITVTALDPQKFDPGILCGWVAIIEERERAHGQCFGYTRFLAHSSAEALDEIEQTFRAEWKRDEDGLLWNVHFPRKGANSMPVADILIDEYTGEAFPLVVTTNPTR